jgi:uncharacterized small protein (DUF1192 family)
MAITVMRAGSVMAGSVSSVERKSYDCRAAMTTAAAIRYTHRKTKPGCEAAMEEPAEPRKKTVHEIGTDLSLLSVFELKERIGALQEEIGRIEAAIRRKESSKSAADTFFKR